MQNTPQILKHRVITMLEREELEFLDKLGKDSLFSTGHKLSYNEILKSLIDFAMEMGLSREKVNSLESIKAKLAELAQKGIRESVRQIEKEQGGHK